MKHKISILLLSLLAVFSITTGVKADEYLRVGMEAAYAPFNWTQEDDSNGAVPIEGTNQFANGYDVQVAKKIAESMNKELLVVKTKWEGLVPALTSGKIDMIIAGMSPTEERKKEIIAKLEKMDKDAVAEVAKPFVEENVTRLESEMKALRSQIDAEDYKLLPISYIAKTYFNKSASWLLQRLNGYQVRGKIYTLNQEQKGIFNQAVKEISNRISALQLA